MANLLMHSMAEFAEIIFKAFEITGVKTVAEIGAEYGTMTEGLLEYTGARGGQLHSVDPSPSPDAEDMFAQCDHGQLVKDLSVNVLSSITADAYLVDGDHNYYTVLTESNQIWAQALAAKKHFLVFYHDVGWPCARRDLYYDPDRIPPEYRHDHVWNQGVTLDNRGLVPGGFRGEGQWACATKEGGARNGVLTAVEDFVMGKEAHLSWALIPAVFGLGILFAKNAPWADALAEFVLPYHMNPLLERMERNRLECYLDVLA